MVSRRMSSIKTIVTFASGRTLRLNGNWVGMLSKRSDITQYQFFSLTDEEGFDTVINMHLVETVKVVDE